MLLILPEGGQAADKIPTILRCLKAAGNVGFKRAREKKGAAGDAGR